MTPDVLGEDGLPIDAPERRRLPPLLRRAWYSLNQAFRRRLIHLELTPDQFTVLRTILENGGLTQSQLTDCMSSDVNTVAALLERMERNGLVSREKDQRDRRAHRISIRPLGRRRYEAARLIAVGLQTEILEVLPSTSRDQFLRNLNAVADACRGAADSSPRNGAKTKSWTKLRSNGG